MPSGNRSRLINTRISKDAAHDFSTLCRCGVFGGRSGVSLIEEFGPDTLLLDILDRATCKACGDRGQYDVRIIPVIGGGY